MSQGPVPAAVDTPGDEPCAQIWSVYISEAEKYDKALVDSWRGNMNGILIFAGLFSAVLTSFIIESYTILQSAPDPNTLILAHIAQQFANATNTASLDQSVIDLISKTTSSAPSHASLACNILWFLSLGLSLACALAATLVEQWARDFLQRTEMLPSPVKRARIFAYLYYGLQRFRMHVFVGAIPLLLHMSLLLFLGGLIPFLLPVNKTVAYVAVGILVVLLVFYLGISILPLIQFDCPYKTPLSPVLWSIRRYYLLFMTRHEKTRDVEHVQEKTSTEPSPIPLPLRSMSDAMIHTATFRDVAGHREARDERALAWTMKSLADDDELEPFVEGIPNAIFGPHGRRLKYDNLIRGLLNNPDVLLGSRIEHLLWSCESGLLEPLVKSRRQLTCLKAVWCLGMMAEKNSSLPRQPLFFLKNDLLPPKTNVTAQYLPSIDALADWNNLCSLHGIVERINHFLADGKEAVERGKLPDIARCSQELNELLSERDRCKWDHLIPIRAADVELDLKQLSEKIVPLQLHSVSEWMRQVSKIMRPIPACWNGLQYRVLLSFLQQSADLERPPYEFLLTCQTIQARLEFADIPFGHVAKVFEDCVRKAVRDRDPSVNHVDTILSILLPWFDTTGIDVDVVDHLTDSAIEYLNNRDLNEAICRVLQDCDITQFWNRLTDRLSTCRRDSLGDVSKAMWHLSSLFPGQSTLEVRLPDWPHFNRNTVSVVCASPYSASVMALLKNGVLMAFEQAEVRLHLQRLETLLMGNVENALTTKSRSIQSDWGLLSAVCAVLHPIVASGQPVPELEPFPAYTIQPMQAYRDWLVRALASVRHALQLIPHLEGRFEEARLVIVTEFMQSCVSDGNSTLPYKATETLDDHVLPVLWVSRPAHRTNQRNFAGALRELAESSGKTDDHLQLLQAVIASELFNEGLPWLSDPQALSTIKSVLQTYLSVAFAGGGTGPSRKLEDILNWLELKELAHESESLGPLGPGRNDAGPSRLT